MALQSLYLALANTLDGKLEIEAEGRAALIHAADQAELYGDPVRLDESLLTILNAADANPACAQIAEISLPWSPPTTSNDPTYVEHSRPKVHVELVGPSGFAQSDTIRIGLYGMLPGHEYGIRTHPAEEVFVMLAGEADWKRGDGDYRPLLPGQRSYHPSMLPHANRTREVAFMSLYIWHGDIDTSGYVYEGIEKN